MFIKLTRTIAACCLLISSGLHAADIPAALQEWQGWVLKKHPDIHCPFLYNDAQRTCVWASELSIDVGAQGARFTQRIETYNDNWVSLPGSTGFWPENVRDLTNQLNDSTLHIRERAGTPEIFLPSGRYELQGDIRWSNTPRTLTIPPASGLIKLQLNGTTVPSPSLESNNQLWLTATQDTEEPLQKDSLQLRVFRRVNDGIPLRVTTRMQLDVSGKERELQMGQLLLDGFTPIAFDSPLPARIESDGKIRIQVKPGSWELELQMQSTTPRTNLGYKAMGELWPQQEIWVVTPQPGLRSIHVSGAPGIDPTQTQLPDEWRELPAYLLTPDTSIQLEELQRGAGDNNNQLTLDKEIWLDFDGQGFTLRDEISGQLRDGWRIETLPSYELQSATLNDTPLLVTQLEGSDNSGVEIRNREINLETISRMVRTTNLPVTGWSVDFTEVDTLLHLPPGWSLLAATGTSYESGSWISQWSLWDIFLVLIITFAVSRITTPLWGGLALITLTLTLHRSGAPLFIWLNIIAVLALLPMVSGKFKAHLIRYTQLSFILLALLLLPFTVQQARQVFYPQQEFTDRNIAEYYAKKTWSPILMSSDNKKAESSESSKYSSDVEEVLVTGMRSMAPGKQQVSQEYDPGQQVQTGPGIPDWNWHNINLSWNGLVKPDEVTQLYLIPPAVNRLGNALSVLLPLLLGVYLLQLFLRQTGHTLPSLRIGKHTVLPAILLITGSLIPTDHTQADVLVSNALLKELETRLTQPAQCLPDCVSIESLLLTVEGDKLTIEILIHSADSLALPLPAQRQQWWPNQVLINNKAAALVQDANGRLLVNLRKGRNQLNLSAAIPGKDNISLAFPLPLHNLTSNLQGWQLSGAPTTTQPSSNLQLQRSERSEAMAKAEHLQPDPIAPFVTITRHLQLGLDWRVETRVNRVAPAQGAINIEIPLIAGESPIGGDLPITGDEATNGKIRVQMGTDQQQTFWYSTLKAESPLELKAPSNPSWIEVWTLETSPIWHTEVTGIPSSNTGSLPMWQPWPNESISIAVSRPQAIQGNGMSIDNANLKYTLGDRANSAILSLFIRTNQAGHYDFTLPEGANLEGILIDGDETNLQATNGKIKIPLHPGEQELEIYWQGSDGINLSTRSPSIALNSHSSNQSIDMNLPHGRWLLLVGGPSIGPAVLLWGILAVTLLLAAALGRSNLTPLRTHQWILLSLGVATVNLYVLALIAIWLVLLTKRGALTHIPSRTRFKWMQLGLFGLSLISLALLLGSIPYSLLANPDMHIAGNGSNAHYLRWYQDQSASEFPQAWILSFPLWTYKLAMLIWSLWLASALTQWIRWGWQQLSHHALWYAPDSILPTTADATHQDKKGNNNSNQPVT